MTSLRHSSLFGDRLDHLPLEASRDDAPVFTKASAVVFILVVGLFVAARLWQLSTFSLWSDEVFSLAAARSDWGGLINFVIEDIVNPPLFYLLLKLWIGIGGESLLWLKLFPALTSIAAIVPLLLLGRELKLRASEINLTLLLMAVNGYMIFYAQEVRMYSLVVFFSLCSLWLFVRFYNSVGEKKKPLLALFVANLLLVYTHYYGWMVVGVEGVFLLFWGRRKLMPFLTSVAVLALCLSPWAYAVVRVATRVGLEGKTADFAPRWIDVVGYYATLNGLLPGWGTRVALLLFAYPVMLWTWRVFKGPQSEEDSCRVAAFWLLALFSFLPVVISYINGQAFPRFFLPRYLIIVAVPYMMLVATAAHRLRPFRVRAATVLFMAGYATLAGIWAANNEPYRIRLEALVQRMIQAEPPQASGIMVYTAERGIIGAMRFYLEEANEGRFQAERVDDLDNVHGDHFWVMVRGPESGRHHVREEWRDRGYRVGEGFADGDKVFLFPVWRQ